MTATSELVISSVSNWGGYGLVAALSRRSGRNLLPSLEYEQDLEGGRGLEWLSGQATELVWDSNYSRCGRPWTPEPWTA